MDHTIGYHPPQDIPSVLEAIAEAGVALMVCGAEVSRVEDTMERLAIAYRIQPIEAVVLPTALFVYGSNGQTILKRIRHRSVNLAVLSAINQLSRDVSRQPISVAEFVGRLEQARKMNRYPSWANLLFAAAGAAFISQLMGGNVEDLIPALIAGAITQGIRQSFWSTGYPNSIRDLLSAMIAVVPALVSAVAGLPAPGSILVGGVMVLAPGLLMTTAVRDGIAGDLLSAAARFLEALIIGGAIAAGATLPFYAYLALGGRWP